MNTTEITRPDYAVSITPVVKINDEWASMNFGAPIGTNYRLLALPTNVADPVYDTIYDHEIQAVDFAMKLSETKTVKIIPPAWMHHFGILPTFKVHQLDARGKVVEVIVSRKDQSVVNVNDASYDVNGITVDGGMISIKENVNHRDAVKAMVEYQLLDRTMKFRQPFGDGFKLGTDDLIDTKDDFPFVIQLTYRREQIGQLQKFRTVEERNSHARALVESFGITDVVEEVAPVAYTNNAGKVDLPA